MKKKYRFKTEQEFISEYGINWRDTINRKWRSDNRMDFLFGMEIDNVVYVESIKKDGWNFGRGVCSGYIISTDMIKEVNVINYNEKKTLVYD